MIVGWYLTDAQVGTYALAVGIIGVTAIWRTGGFAQILPSLRPQEFDSAVPPQFAWAAAWSFASAAITMLVAERLDLIGDLVDTSGADGLQPVLWVFAARCLLIPMALLGRGRLATEHRFIPLAKADAAFSLIRVVVTWAIARSGGGALALAIPNALQFAGDIAVAALLGAYRRTDFSLKLPPAKTVAQALAWPFFLAILASTRTDVTFLVISIAMPASSLGVFYFAYQLSNQPTVFLSASLPSVLGAMVARNRGSEEAERNSVERVLRGAMLFVPVTTMAVAAIFPAMERLIWDGKWSDAAVPIALLSVSATFSAVSGLLSGPLFGLARFQEAFWFDVLRLTGVLSGALAGVVLGLRSSTGTDLLVSSAGGVAFGVTISSIIQICWISRIFGITLADTGQILAFGPALAGLTAMASHSIGASLTLSAGIEGYFERNLFEMAVVATVYTALIALAIRFTAETVLRETLSLLPSRYRNWAHRLLQL